MVKFKMFEILFFDYQIVWLIVVRVWKMCMLFIKYCMYNKVIQYLINLVEKYVDKNIIKKKVVFQNFEVRKRIEV